MPGRKEKKKEKGGRSDGGGLAMFLGGGGMPDFNEDDLEAELLAMTGGGVSKGKKKGGGSSSADQVSMADVNKMIASASKIGEDDEDDDEEGGSDIDDSELLAELEGMEDEEEGEDEEMDVTPLPSVRQPPAPTKPVPTKPVAKTGSGDLQVVSDRLSTYKVALETAKSKGESSKVRRYDRAITSMNQMMKDLKAGRRINMEDLPPEVSLPPSSKGVPPSTGVAPKRKANDDDDDDLAELAEWARHGTDPAPAPPAPKRPSVDVGVISDRLKMYQEALKGAETAGDSNKVRRFKRSIDTIVAMEKDAKGGRPVNMDILPPVIATTPKAPPTIATPTDKPPVVATAVKSPPNNLIDLDDPEFDEFNLSEEDMEAMMNTLQLSSNSTTTTQAPAPVPRATPPAPSPKPRTTPPAPAPRPQATPPKPQVTPPKPQATPPKPQTTPNRPPGLIDLDTEEFAEFDLSDEDLAILAAQMNMAKPTPPPSVATPPVAAPPDKTTQSLPTQLVQPAAIKGVTKEQVRAVLVERKDQYMHAMKIAKGKGDINAQKQYGNVAVQFNRVIKSFDQGEALDLSGTPPPPPGYTSKYGNINISSYKSATPTTESIKGGANVVSSPQSSVTSSQQGGGGAEGGGEIPIPKTPLEGLQQRLDKYKEGVKSAQEKGESSRVRRLGRIIKQYEEAIKDTKAGKYVNYDDLPAPPGYPPIPVARAPPTSRPVQSLPASAQKPPPQLRPKVSVNDTQVKALKQRGAEFQKAAREAKERGDKETIVMYMRYYKAIEQMIVVAEGGMPVDMSQVPPSPYSDPSKAGPSKGVLSHLEKASEGDEETFDLIEQQLQEQKDICSENASIYEKLGNIGAAAQYKNMADRCQRDLLAIKGIRKQGLTAPKFTMEMRKFAIVHSNPSLSENKIEIEVVRGITVPPPSGYSEQDLNIYVEVEFPWPQDAGPKEETDKIKGSSNPEFNSKITFDIDRKQMRSLQRIFKRQPIRCTLYQHRTLRKHIFMGVALIPLESLENKCEIHSSEDLKDEKGRRAIGGKLEVYVRLREPLSGCDQEEKEQKWLVFQEAIAAEPTVKMLRPPASGQAVSPIKVEQTTSMDALKLEFSLVQSAVKAGKRDAALIQRGKAIQARLKLIQQQLQRDPNFRREYIASIVREIKVEKAFEQQLMQSGKIGEVKILQGRRKVMENELTKMQKK